MFTNGGVGGLLNGGSFVVIDIGDGRLEWSFCWWYWNKAAECEVKGANFGDMGGDMVVWWAKGERSSLVLFTQGRKRDHMREKGVVTVESKQGDV